MRASAKDVGWMVGNVGMSSWLRSTGKLIAEERDRRNLFNYRTGAEVNDIRKQLQMQSFVIPAELHKSNHDTIYWNSFKKENERGKNNNNKNPFN